MKVKVFDLMYMYIAALLAGSLSPRYVSQVLVYVHVLQFLTWRLIKCPVSATYVFTDYLFPDMQVRLVSVTICFVDA